MKGIWTISEYFQQIPTPFFFEKQGNDEQEMVLQNKSCWERLSLCIHAGSFILIATAGGDGSGGDGGGGNSCGYSE